MFKLLGLIALYFGLITGAGILWTGLILLSFFYKEKNLILLLEIGHRKEIYDH